MMTHSGSVAFLAAIAMGAGCATTGSVGSNTTAARRFVEEFLGGKNPAAFDELVDPKVVAYTGLKPDGPIQGAAQYKQIFGAFSAAFPEVKMTIEELFATEDRVVVRFSAVAKHEGDFFGVKATHRPITMNETHVLRFKDGRIVENRVSANNFEFELLMAPVLVPMIMPWLAGR